MFGCEGKTSPTAGVSPGSCFHRLTRLVRRLSLLLLPAMLLVGVTGCGKSDPIKQLYKDHVLLKFEDQYAREKVVSATFPRSANDETVALMQGPAFQDIQQVDLSNTRITNAALEHLKSLKSLVALNLSNTNIDDEGVAQLSELTNLRSLDLGDTLVTGDGLKHLKTLKSLQSLVLTGKAEPKEPKHRSWKTAFRLGIDLSGGTNLVYQVEPTEEQKITTEAMDQTVGAVKKRLDPSGTEEITVRRVGSDRIEVIIPQADPEVVAEKKRLMTRLGTLEFALLANRIDNQGIINKAMGVQRDVREGGRVIAGWRDIALDSKGIPKSVGTHGSVVTREPDGRTQFLVIFDRPKARITGEYLKRAFRTTDENGRPAVGFQFNTRGAQLFASLTGRNLPLGDHKRRLAILLDGKIESAPQINSLIQGNGIIEGRFTQEEVDELVNVLNAGSLKLPFKTDAKGNPTPISEQTISPLLGADVQQKGQFAIVVAAAVVFLFMLAYYLFPGVIADLSLILNLILVMGAMTFIDAAFTLPGLAGIVLTIGMAVDANVLIFERIREERNRGSSPRMAIQNGFGRAFTTIVDANLTTLITAVVLYMIGTDQVRGFAVTLFIGIVMSMFSSLYFGRLLFDICERKRIVSLKMNSVVGATNWNFISKKTICATLSLLVIVAGIVGVVIRGNDLLDIDLDGGSMVVIELKTPLQKEGTTEPSEQIKDVLEKSDVLRDGLTVEELTLRGEDGKEQTGSRFRIRGKEKDANRFKDAIYDTLMQTDNQKYALRQVRITEFSDDMVKSVVSPSKKKGAGGDQSLVPTEFVGGHRVDLTLSDDGMKTSTFKSYLDRHLTERSDAGKTEKTYSETDLRDWIRVDGLTESSAPKSQGEQPKYQKVRVYAKSEVARADLIAAIKDLKTELDTQPVFPEVNTFDAVVAADMRTSAMLAMLFSLAAIVGYIWFRFQRATFGIAAVVALVHDVLVVLGVVALAGMIGGPWLDFRINLPMIAAFLTIVGYSLNDTIVVFDRVREVRGKNPALTDDMVNNSLNQTLSRTLLTSLTTFIVVAILYGWGGEGIRGFAFCLVLGVIVGTYSSIYVASPVLLWLMNRPNGTQRRTVATAQNS